MGNFSATPSEIIVIIVEDTTGPERDALVEMSE